MNEKRRLNNISWDVNYSLGVMGLATRYCSCIFLSNMVKGSVLEVGPAEGIMTAELYPHFKNYSVLDGAEKHIELISKNFPLINCFNCLLEEFEADTKYDNIVLGHVLEHVDNPFKVLEILYTKLAVGGRLLCAVPNAESLHRTAAVMMNILESNYTLNNTDESNGHRRVYDMKSLKNEFQQVGFDIINSGGYWLKTLSNKQIDNCYTEDMNNAYMRIGELFPEVAAEIYIIATK